MTVLIVGTSFHTLREYLTGKGHEFVTLRDIRGAKSPEKQFKKRVVCDFSTPDSIRQALEIVKNKYSVNAVMATYENYIQAAAFVAHELGVPGLPLEAAEACTDKELMRQRFQASLIQISPDFSVVTSEEDLKNFAASHDFPLILKPANLAKSLLVTKNNSLEELLQNYQRATQSIEKIYAKYAPQRTPKLIVEEFLQGPIHSVDAFVDANGTPHVLEQVVDYQTGYDIGYEDNFHYSRLLPSALSIEERDAVREVARLGCQALGMKNSPAHVEIIRTPKGPRLVEIGARNGGYRERMHALANGIDITGNALRVACGQAPTITSERNEPCAVLELFPKQPGKFAGINNLETMEMLSSLVYYDIKAEVGEFRGRSADGFKMCAVIMLHNSDVDQFTADLAYVNENVFVLTETL